MMLPQINPYYFQQQAFQMPQFNNYPQSVSQVQMSTINGRLIDNIDSITANDVSMQGISVFPKNDLSEVYVKSWLPSGTIQTIRYCRNDVIERKNDVSGNYIDEDAKRGYMTIVNDYKAICERLDGIENQLKEMLNRKDTQNESKGNVKHDAARKSTDKE